MTKKEGGGVATPGKVTRVIRRLWGGKKGSKHAVWGF